MRRTRCAYTVIYEQGDTTWGAYVPDLPGCTAVGASRSEAEDLIVEAIAAYLDDLREAGQPIPAPRSASGLAEVA
jgi:predicted RNase H-like HicB family nuclease